MANERSRKWFSHGTNVHVQCSTVPLKWRCSLEVSMRSELKVTRTFCNSRWAIEKGGEKEYANSLFHAIFSVKSESALLENVARCSFNATDGGSCFLFHVIFYQVSFYCLILHATIPPSCRGRPTKVIWTSFSIHRPNILTWIVQKPGQNSQLIHKVLYFLKTANPLIVSQKKVRNLRTFWGQICQSSKYLYIACN